ncbi:MAG: hypothetical protein ABII13_01280 [Patescibacteria group bacterium]
MMNKHAKSPCCGASVRHYGERRRQCLKCSGTWRIRKKKRGRKQRRTNKELILNYFKNRTPLRTIAERQQCGKDAVQVALARSRDNYIETELPKWLIKNDDHGPLIAVADAIWYRIRREKYTIYVILLRPISSSSATIRPPVVIHGHEDLDGWKKAFDSLLRMVQNRTIAMVCDGGKGLVSLAKSRKWILQRCHFHLIAAVQNYLTTGPRSKNPEYAQRVHQIVKDLLHARDPQQIATLSQDIQNIHDNSKSKGLRRVLRGLLKDLPDYHTYHRYPGLNLPATSNSVESCIRCMRDLMSRCRGFRSKQTLIQWLTAFSLYKETIKCRGKNQPN